MNPILHYMLVVGGIASIVVGFLHFAFVDWLFSKKSYYAKMKFIIGKITVALTLVVIIAVAIFLFTLLFERFKG